MITQEKARLQRLLSLLSIGLCDALQDGSISHDEAEQLLFSPHTMRFCENIGAARQLLDLVHEGTELHSIKRLVGIDQWTESLNKIRENARYVLEQTDASDSQLERWVDRMVGDE